LRPESLADTPFPYFFVEGADARARGQALGESAREMIAASVDSYAETFGHYTKLGWEAIQVRAEAYGPQIEACDREIAGEIKGIAEGARLTHADVLALNARSELMFGLAVPVPPECTSFFAGGAATAEGEVLIGQNWDWRPRAVASTIITEVDQGAHRPALMMVPEAGMVGKFGLNEAGIGVTLNALVSDRDAGSPGVPIHVILRRILDSWTLGEALAAIVAPRRGASASFTIADANGVGIGIESGPGGVESVFLTHPVGGMLAHANHFEAPVPFVDEGRAAWPDSPRRTERMRRLLLEHRGEVSTSLVEEILRDTDGEPNAICRRPDPTRHPVEQAGTVAAAVFDLTSLTARIAAGPPDESDFQTVVPTFARGGPQARTKHERKAEG
jgi:isopenicillin-N N-acyltransferase like protein